MIKIRTRQVIVGILAAIYLILAICLFFMQHVFEKDISENGANKRTNNHGLFSLAGLCTLGLGMMLYRLFRGARSRLIKYVHLVVQSLALIFLLIGFVCAFTYGLSYNNIYPLGDHNITISPEVSDEEYFSKMEEIALHFSGRAHYFFGYMMLVCIIIQWIVGVIIFVWMYPETKMRRNFAPIHDILGIWIYMGLVCTYLTGIFYLHDHQIGCCADNETLRSMQHLTPPAYLSSLIVFCAVLSPYFEWDYVGPL